MPDNPKNEPQVAADSNVSRKETLPWWHEGIVAASQVTGWIVVPLVAALYGGQYLDRTYGTTNVFFLSTTGLAFIISCIGIARIGSRYIQSISQISSKTSKPQQNNNESDNHQ